MAIDPCGLTCDFLRSAYKTEMRGVAADGLPIKVRWYRRPDKNPVMPWYSRFASLIWTEGQDGDTTLGEIPGAKPWWNGKFKPRRNRKKPCGAEEVWQRGFREGDPTSSVTNTGESACCAGLPGGLVLSGGATDPWEADAMLEVVGTVSADLVTVATDCCPGTGIPTRLQARFVEVDEPCWAGVVIPLFWNGTTWTGTGTVGSCGYDLTLALRCDTSGGPGFEHWVLNAVASNLCVNGDGPPPFTGSTCSPFVQLFILSPGTWVGACSAQPILAGWIQVETIP